LLLRGLLGATPTAEGQTRELSCGRPDYIPPRRTESRLCPTRGAYLAPCKHCRSWSEPGNTQVGYGRTDCFQAPPRVRQWGHSTWRGRFATM